jgi:hypothetical protein
MAFKVEYNPNNKADEIIDAEDYHAEDGWFVFTRFEPGDYPGGGQVLQVARINAGGVRRIDLVESK